MTVLGQAKQVAQNKLVKEKKRDSYIILVALNQKLEKKSKKVSTAAEIGGGEATTVRWPPHNSQKLPDHTLADTVHYLIKLMLFLVILVLFGLDIVLLAVFSLVWARH